MRPGGLLEGVLQELDAVDWSRPGGSLAAAAAFARLVESPTEVVAQDFEGDRAATAGIQDALDRLVLPLVDWRAGLDGAPAEGF